MRLRWRWEIVLVLALSLGQSAVYSIIRIIDVATQGPISSATASLNTQQSLRPVFDALYTTEQNLFALAPAALAIFLLYSRNRSGFSRLGIDPRFPARDALTALALLVIIGVPSLGMYALGRALRITAQIVPNGMEISWWSVLLLVFAAFRNGCVEEVIVVGFLLTRLRQLGFTSTAQIWLIIAISAVIRGSYHLYQGIGPFIGNVAMGVLFGWIFTKTKRVMPLIIAHSLIDAIAFIFGRQLGFG